MPGVVDELIAEVIDPYINSSDTEVLHVNGRELHFKRFKSPAEIREMHRQAIDFVAVCQDAKRRSKAWDIRESDKPEDLTVAFVIHYTSAEPTRISQAQALKLIRRPNLAEAITTFINTINSQGAVLEYKQAVEEAKKGSSQTQLGE